MELPDRELRQQDQTWPCSVVLYSDLPQILESKSMRVFGLKQDKTRQDKTRQEKRWRGEVAETTRLYRDMCSTLKTVYKLSDRVWTAVWLRLRRLMSPR